MAGDQGPVVQSALLREELVRLRKDSGLTQEEVAVDLEWSPSKLIRIEGGQSKITKVDLDALLTKYGVTSESHRERLQALNRGARERAWWDSYRNDVSPTYLNYVGFEAGASFIRQFQIVAVPGLLQTAGYAENLTARTFGEVTPGGGVAPGRAESIVELRLRRQAELGRRLPPLRQYFVLDEAAIRRHVGAKTNPAIMPDQLRSIADRAERDKQVTIRVLPFEAGAHPGLGLDPFTLLGFEGGLSDVLYFDPGWERAMNLVTGDTPEVAEAARVFERLLEDALSAERSIELIRLVAAEMSGHGHLLGLPCQQRP
jgi:transcriptional regulator with XRE-family HTH domain